MKNITQFNLVDPLAALLTRASPNYFDTSHGSEEFLAKTDAYCYLVLVLEKYRTSAKNFLNAMPTREALAYLSQISPDWFDWESQHFAYTVTRPQGMKAGHALVHVFKTEQAKSQLTTREVLNYCPPLARFGADPINDMANGMGSLTLSTQPSSMYVTAGAFPTAPTLLAIGRIKSNTKTVFSPTKNRTMRLMLMLFESARIESVKMTVYLPAGKHIQCFVAVSPQIAKPKDYYGEPIVERFGGNDFGPTSHNWELPPHQFGQEIRAAALGNKPPQFHFYVNGSTSETYAAVVRIYIKVHLAGQGIVNPFDFHDDSIELLETTASSVADVGREIIPTRPTDAE